MLLESDKPISGRGSEEVQINHQFCVYILIAQTSNDNYSY